MVPSCVGQDFTPRVDDEGVAVGSPFLVVLPHLRLIGIKSVSECAIEGTDR